jgi:hypothetical protein
MTTIASIGEGLSLGRRRLSHSRAQGSRFRLPCAVFMCCAPGLPRCSPCSPPAPLAPLILLLTPLSTPPLLPPAPSVLPLNRLCSLSRSKTEISNPKFGVDIIYIYYIHPELRIGNCRFRSRKGAGPL